MLAEDDAEGMADGVGENPEACFAFTWDTSGAQGEQLLFGQVGIAHPGVQMQLLGDAGSGHRGGIQSAACRKAS